MKTVRTVGWVWALAAVALCGCGGGASSSTVGSPSGSAKERQPAQLDDATKATPETEPAKVGTTAEFTASLQKIGEKLQQAAGRKDIQAFLAGQRSILKLCDQVLASNPEPELRDQVIRVWFESAVGRMGVTSIQRKDATDLLDPLDQIADSVIEADPESETAALAYFAKIVGHLNVESEASRSDPSVNARLFEWAKEFIGKFPKDENAPRLLFPLAALAEESGQLDTAREIYRFGQGFELADPGIVRGFVASLRWLDVKDSIGKPLALAGPTLAGPEINVEQFKGKVVLVDFWATWCGPCLKELPNVKKVYAKYHEEGLEIIAVSLDRERPDVESFVANRKIPWAQIFFDEEGKQFWDNPLAQQFGIQGIPQTFLLDREGKLVKIGVSGPELDPAVKELLDAPAPESN